MSNTIETKHTPSPWALDFRHKKSDSAEDGSIIEVIYLGNGYPQSICTIWTNGLSADNFDEQGRANARLIAAAPDMLAALERLAQEFEDNHEVPDYVYGAIRKARGTE